MNQDQKYFEDSLDASLLVKPTKVSPSTINSFIETRSKWYMGKVAGVSSFVTSDYLQRGKGIESGLQCLLQGGSEQDAVEVAVKELWNFEDTIPQEQVEKIKDYEFYMPQYLKCAWEHYSRYHFFKLQTSQAVVEYQPDYCSFKLYGYVDFLYDRMWTDLKVLSRKPSGLTQGYSIQGAVYHLATNKPGIFTCLVRTNPKGGPQFNMYEEHLLKQPKPFDFWSNYLRMACIAMEGVYDCAQSGDVDNLIKHMSFPNLDAYYGDNEINEAFAFWSKL